MVVDGQKKASDPLREFKICMVSSKQCYVIEKEGLEDYFKDEKHRLGENYKIATKRIFPKTAERELKKVEKRYDCIIRNRIFSFF